MAEAGAVVERPPTALPGRWLGRFFDMTCNTVALVSVCNRLFTPGAHFFRHTRGIPRRGLREVCLKQVEEDT